MKYLHCLSEVKKVAEIEILNFIFPFFVALKFSYYSVGVQSDLTGSLYFDTIILSTMLMFLLE